MRKIHIYFNFLWICAEIKLVFIYKKETRRFIFLSFSFVFLFLFLSQINKSDLILFFLHYSYFHSFFSKHTNYKSLRSHDLRYSKLWAITIIQIHLSIEAISLMVYIRTSYVFCFGNLNPYEIYGIITIH
jgi:hypothetical protein